MTTPTPTQPDQPAPGQPQGTPQQPWATPVYAQVSQQPPTPPGRGLAIAALILGIVGTLFGLIPLTFWIAGTCGVIGLVLGLVALTRARRAQASKKMPVAGVTLSAVAMVLSVVGAVIVFTAVDKLGDDLQQASDALASSAPTDVGVPVESLPPTADPTPAYTPIASDFKIELKVKSKDCFGSAGCNITYEPELSIVGPQVDQDGSYEITYEVRGGEDGASIDTIEVDAGQYTASEGIAQTARQSSKITAVITDVESN